METLKTDTGTYRHLPERDMLAELEKANARPSYRPGKIRGARVAPIETLASRYAQTLLHRRATETIGPIPVHVYPVLASGRGTAADFRKHLAAELTSYPPYCDRDYLEHAARAAGFPFVEVATGDFL